ncbi:Ubiquitin-conjugating enzyme E2 S [Vanrija pseudolonga]|uniref:E2 ubiquitin-conjugating enzyme n=1 Tax=Vanrija pseudolonga TaxID=143232 RepID=A0AAF0XZJ2_9TREE|nr:Ubiquitin-conjugating enzyme E2 S [Vanrija pseudolonga]
MSLTPQALRLLSRELVTLRTEPPEGVRVVVDEDDLTALEGWVQGPAGTPYEGGYFRVRFDFGPEYPNLPPKCTMLTKIFHPNISKAGEICVDTLKKGWRKDYGVAHVLVTIKCLLIYPNPESALDEEAGKQLLADYDGYCKYARLLTGIHATPKLPPAPFRDASVKSVDALLPQPPVASAPSTRSSPSSPQNSSPQPTASRPSPLGNHARQETSPAPVVPAAGFDSVVKPVVKAAPKPAAKAKRGLKRL